MKIALVLILLCFSNKMIYAYDWQNIQVGWLCDDPDCGHDNYGDQSEGCERCGQGKDGPTRKKK